MTDVPMSDYTELKLDYNHDNLESKEVNKICNKLDINLINLYIENLTNFYNFGGDTLNILEIELRAFQNIKEFGGVSNTLNKAQFDNLINFFQNYDSEIEEGEIISNKEPDFSLDIFVHSESNLNLKDELSKLRFTINGKADIQQYCHNNIIPPNCNLIYKEILNWHSNTDQLRYNLNETYSNQFNRPENHNIENSNGIIDLFSSKIRLGGKLEIPFNYIKNEFDFSGVQHTDYFYKLKKTSESTIKKYNSLSETFKSFRLKERYSFEIDSYIRVDLTKVKSSKKDIDNNYFYNTIPVKKFIDSEILEQIESYEFEIEIINFSQLSKKELHLTISKAINIVKKINCIVDERLGFTYHNLSQDVLYIYKQYIKKIYLDRINEKLKICDYCIELKQQSKNKDPLLEFNKYSLFHKIKTEDKSQLLKRKSKLEQSKLTILRKIENNSQDTLFISPKPVSISMDDIREENPQSIRNNYCVTDKADGMSSLLFKVGIKLLDSVDIKKYQYLKNRIFLIDSNVKVYDTGVLLNDDINDSIILNGEFLNYNKHKNIMNKFGVYDAYLSTIDSSQNIDISYLPLISSDKLKDTRIKHIQKFIELFDSKQLENFYKFQIFLKKFYLPEKNIFEATNHIWSKFINDENEYYLDGTIYTPIEFPVGYNESKFDYDLFPSSTWFSNFKWKPPHDNTIDFLIKFEKEIVSEFKNKRIFKNKIKNILNSDSISFTKYLIVNLYNTGRTLIRNKNQCENNDTPLFGKTKAIKFDPENEDENTVLFKLITNSFTNKEYILDEDLKTVEDETIIEVKYENFNTSLKEYQSNKKLRFSILRTRHDKTYMLRLVKEYQIFTFKIISKILFLIDEYKKGAPLSSKEINFINKNISKIYNNRELNNVDKRNYIDKLKTDLIEKKKEFTSYQDVTDLPFGLKHNYGNSVEVAKNIWTSIHNPITAEMITSGINIPNVSIDEEKYYNNNILHRRDKSITLALQNFHNKIIKNKILLGNAVKLLRKDDPNLKINLLDLCCGKGGDIGKWIDNKIDICIGIDLFDNNINDPNNGACHRYNFYRKKNSIKNIPRMEFLVGDVSNNLYDKSAFKSQYDKDKFNKLWYEDSQLQFSLPQNKFNIISIMFALHYFFKNKHTLDNLIKNIDQNLHKDGIIIGACFDGKTVFEMLKDILIDESIEGISKGYWIWKITKNYNQNTLPDNEDSLNLSIKVAMRSINKVIEEFLVNFQYFQEQLLKINIDILEQEECSELILPIDDGLKLSTGLFKTIFEIDIEEISDENLKSIFKNASESMEVAERKISFLNRYFIFKRKAIKNSLVSNIYEFIKKNKDIVKYSTHIKNKTLENLEQTIYDDMELDVEFTLFQNYYKEAIDKIYLDKILPKIKVKLKKKLPINKQVSTSDSLESKSQESPIKKISPKVKSLNKDNTEKIVLRNMSLSTVSGKVDKLLKLYFEIDMNKLDGKFKTSFQQGIIPEELLNKLESNVLNIISESKKKYQKNILDIVKVNRILNHPKYNNEIILDDYRLLTKKLLDISIEKVEYYLTNVKKNNEILELREMISQYLSQSLEIGKVKE